MILAVALFLTVLAGQTPGPPELTRLLTEFRAALDKQDFNKAAEIAAKLNDGIQEQQRALLLQEGHGLVDTVLTWLPEDAESLLVDQHPFTIDADQDPDRLFGQITEQFALGRLARLDGGKFHKALHGRTIRLAVACDKNITTTAGILPPLAEATIVQVYRFTKPIDSGLFGPPTSSVEGRPAWRAIAKIAGRWQPGVRNPPPRDDENWVALAEPDLLVLSNSLPSLEQVLGRIAKASPARAFPASLPEWKQVDRMKPVWGLRHYSGERPEPQAVGATLQFDPQSRNVDFRYLSGAQQLETFARMRIGVDFELDRSQAGVWRLTSNLHDRGDFPGNVAMGMLGFGRYY